MEISYTLTKDDYSNFNKFYYFKIGIKKRFIAVIIAAFLLPFISTLGSSFHLPTYIRLVGIAFVVFGVIYLGLGYLRAMTTGSVASKGLSVLGEIKLKLNDEGIYLESETNSSTVEWDNLNTIEESKNYLYLFVNKFSALIIPKRAFKDENEFIAFSDIFEKKRKN